MTCRTGPSSGSTAPTLTAQPLLELDLDGDNGTLSQILHGILGCAAPMIASNADVVHTYDPVRGLVNNLGLATLTVVLRGRRLTLSVAESRGTPQGRLRRRLAVRCAAP